jgi:CDP-glycerol glycerophosphotransferase (TagB/SpsB family)
LKFDTIRTKTTDLRRWFRRVEEGNIISYVFGITLNRILAHGVWRRMIRALDQTLVSDPGFGALLDDEKPDLVFFANLFDDIETSLLREARRRRIPTIGFINSWDKVTARSTIRLLPDALLVFNDIVKKEIMAHADISEEKISVVGIPQYDRYHNPIITSREEFAKKLSLDPLRPIMMYAPMGSTFSDSDWLMIDRLHTLIEEGALGNLQLLVRFQPNDFISGEELKKRPWLRYDLPGVRFGAERGGDWDMTEADLVHLTDTLAHIALVVCYASSISVDAAIFKKPVININYEIKKASKPSKNPTFYYATEHYGNAVATGGMRLVESEADLVQWINAYIKNPRLDEEGRARLVREQCGLIDGNAARRIAERVLVISG